MTPTDFSGATAPSTRIPSQASVGGAVASGVMVRPPAVSLVDLVERQCARRGGAPAYTSGPRSLSFAELNRRASRLARRLRGLGVGRDCTVGVHLPRDLDLPVALLGILKAGGAYLPLDPAYPVDRIRYILDASDTRLVLAGRERGSDWIPDGVECVHLDEDAGEWSSDLLAPPSPDDLAYVIFTSGSTGRPKGVEVPHRAVVNFLLSMAETPGMGADDVIAAVTTICFDISVLELFLSLVVGARAEIVDGGVARDGVALARTLEACGATMLQATPATWRMLLDSGWKGDASLKALCGGEALAPDLAERLLPKTSELWNMYGPTETTVWSTCSRVAAGKPIRLGEPIANTQLYVVDASGRQCAAGEPGELLIGGAGVARGYRNQPQLTAERFLEDPFGEGRGRLYRTGDLVRSDESGGLEFLGRIDHQVKINGFRIELGEIESVLQSHPQVVESVVVALRSPGDGEQRLAAYFVPRDAPAASAVEQVGEWESLWTNAYREPHDAAGALEFAGWNSSYTGERIASDALGLWADSTARRILERAPDSVLDVGCGVGHLLTRIAPACSRYVGVDLSPQAVDSLRRRISDDASLARSTVVEVGAAHDLPSVAEGRYDAIVFNSVVQYFPGADYLVRALDEAADSLSDDGFLFVGDVRLREWAEAFHASVALYAADDASSTRSLSDRIAHRLAHDPELLVDSQFFQQLAAQREDLVEVALELKRGRSRHELADFRVDAVLSRTGGPPAGPRISWQSFGCDLAGIRRRLADGFAGSFVVAGMPNARLERWRKLLQILKSSERPEQVGELRRLLNELPGVGVEPEDVWALAADTPYRISLVLSESGDPWTFDAVFELIGARRDPSPTRVRGRESIDAPSLETLTNDPLWGRKSEGIASELRERLRAALPDYMAPSAIIPLPRLPRAPNGKIDRAALPDPVADAMQRPQGGRGPGDETERRIQRIWQEMLGIQDIAVDEDFFQLTGTSLTAVRMLVRVKAEFGREVPLSVLLERPTIEHLAASLASDPAPAASRTVVLNRGSSEFDPLFILHGVDGSVLWAYDLVRRLNADQPAIGIQAPGLEGECAPAVSIGELADRAIEEMQRVQPHGPYHLVGWCFGGVLVHAVADRLFSQGEQVGLVALVDAPCPSPAKSAWGRLRLAYEERIRPKALRLGRRAKHFASLSTGGKLGYLNDQFVRRLKTQRQPAASGGGPIFTGMRGGEVHDAHLRALRDYQPRASATDIDLFNAERRAPEFSADPYWGWQGMAGDVRLHRLQGDHNSILKEPHVSLLAERIQEAMNAVRRSPA